MPRQSAWSSLLQVVDAVANDSDKTLTVGASAQWAVHSIYCLLVTTATVGNRQLEVRITDAADLIIAKYLAGAVQAASLTREYIFAPLHPQETAFTGGVMLRALPAPLLVPAGFKIRVWDNAAIDAAADDLTIRVLIEGRAE